MVVSRDRVRACVERALLLDPEGDIEAAIASAAQALGLQVDDVRECVRQEQPA